MKKLTRHTISRCLPAAIPLIGAGLFSLADAEAFPGPLRLTVPALDNTEQVSAPAVMLGIGLAKLQKDECIQGRGNHLFLDRSMAGTLTDPLQSLVDEISNKHDGLAQAGLIKALGPLPSASNMMVVKVEAAKPEPSARADSKTEDKKVAKDTTLSRVPAPNLQIAATESVARSFTTAGAIIRKETVSMPVEPGVVPPARNLQEHLVRMIPQFTAEAFEEVVSPRSRQQTAHAEADKYAQLTPAAGEAAPANDEPLIALPPMDEVEKKPAPPAAPVPAPAPAPAAPAAAPAPTPVPAPPAPMPAQPAPMPAPAAPAPAATKAAPLPAPAAPAPAATGNAPMPAVAPSPAPAPVAKPAVTPPPAVAPAPVTAPAAPAPAAAAPAPVATPVPAPAATPTPAPAPVAAPAPIEHAPTAVAPEPKVEAKKETKAKTKAAKKKEKKKEAAPKPMPATNVGDSPFAAGYAGGNGKELSEESRTILNKIPSNIDKQRAQKQGHLEIDRAAPPAEALTKPEDASELSAKREAMGVNIEIKRPKMDVNYELRKAYDAQQAGRSSDAISIYNDILENDANNKQAMLGLATSYHRTGQIAQARPLYGRVLAMDRNNKTALSNFMVLLADESPDEALSQLKSLQQRNPDFAAVPAQMAVVYQKLKEPQKAVESMAEAVRLAPSNLNYRYNLAILLDRQKDYVSAATLYSQLVEAHDRGEKIPGNIQQIQQRLTFIRSNIP